MKKLIKKEKKNIKYWMEKKEKKRNGMHIW